MRTFLMAGVMTLAMGSAAMAQSSTDDIAASGALFLIFGVLGALC